MFELMSNIIDACIHVICIVYIVYLRYRDIIFIFNYSTDGDELFEYAAMRTALDFSIVITGLTVFSAINQLALGFLILTIFRILLANL